jgi:hypothetical protein
MADMVYKAIRAANDIRDSLMCMPEAHQLDICLNVSVWEDTR